MITLAKKSVALRHWPVGEYFSASLKRRPLTGLWKRRTAAQENLAFWSACFPEMCPPPPPPFCPVAGESAGRQHR